MGDATLKIYRLKTMFFKRIFHVKISKVARKIFKTVFLMENNEDKFTYIGVFA